MRQTKEICTVPHPPSYATEEMVVHEREINKRRHPRVKTNRESWYRDASLCKVNKEGCEKWNHGGKRSAWARAVFAVCGSVEEVVTRGVGECSNAWFLPVILLFKVSNVLMSRVGREPVMRHAEAGRRAPGSGRNLPYASS